MSIVLTVSKPPVKAWNASEEEIAIIGGKYVTGDVSAFALTSLSSGSTVWLSKFLQRPRSISNASPSAL